MADNGPMTSERVRVPGFSAERGLRALAAFGATGLGLSGLAATTGLGIPCPWRALTGTLCPLCGGTHAGMALLRGDLADAWAANQFVVLGLGVLVVLGLLWTVEALGGPAVLPPRSLRARPGLWWVVIGAVAVSFAVARNLVPLG